MKITKIYIGNLVKIGLTTTLGFALAYGYHSLAQSSYFSYLDALIAELETNSVQLAPEDSPSVGLFYSAQFGEEWPPLPANIYEVPFWDLGNGVFLMDDRDVNYVELPSSESRSSIVTPPLRSGQTGNDLPWLTNIAVTVAANSSSTNYITSFDVAGGMTNVAYGLIVATNVISDTQVVLASDPGTNIFPSNISTNNQTWATNSIRYVDLTDWNWIGLAHNGDHFCFTNSTEQGYYGLTHPEIVLWAANNDDGLLTVPDGLGNIVMLSGGTQHRLALSGDGTLHAWGTSNYGLDSVPADIDGRVAMISSGYQFNVALLTNGTVRAWGVGDNALASGMTNVPAGLSGVTAISAFGLHTLALKDDGTVVDWGYDTATVPAGLSNVCAISAGLQHNLALKNDGTVVAWGDNNQNQCNVPAGLSGVIQIAAGAFHSLALKDDGTVAAWGATDQCVVPNNLTNIIQIAAGGLNEADSYSMALKSDGTVAVWGNEILAGTAENLNSIVSINSTSSASPMVIRTGVPELQITVQPKTKLIQNNSGTNCVFSVFACGSQNISYQWEFNGTDIIEATNATLAIQNPTIAQEGVYCARVSNGVKNVWSQDANLYVMTPPEITYYSLPANRSLDLSQSTFLAVEAFSRHQNISPLRYTWKRNGYTFSSGNTQNNIEFTAMVSGLNQISVTIANDYFQISTNWDISVSTNIFYLFPGSLPYHLATNAVGYVSGKTLENNGMLFDNWNKTDANTTNDLNQLRWSTNCWLSGVKGLSATSIGTVGKPSGQGLITMISPIHYLRAWHTTSNYSNFNNNIAFLGTNNQTYWRKPVEQIYVGSSGSDTCVGILNEPLPESVGFLPVLPPDFNYLPMNRGGAVQGIGMNQDAKVFSQPMRFYLTTGENEAFVLWSIYQSPLLGLSTNWNIKLRKGDSSAPERFLIDDQLVLVSHNTYTNAGVNFQYLYNAINGAMETLSTNHYGTNYHYQLTPISLTNYSQITSFIE